MSTQNYGQHNSHKDWRMIASGTTNKLPDQTKSGVPLDIKNISADEAILVPRKEEEEDN